MSVGAQLEHVELPGVVIDEQPVVHEVRAVAIVNLGPHDGKTHLLVAVLREWQQRRVLRPLAAYLTTTTWRLPSSPVQAQAWATNPSEPGGSRLSLRPGTFA